MADAVSSQPQSCGRQASLRAGQVLVCGSRSLLFSRWRPRAQDRTRATSEECDSPRSLLARALGVPATYSARQLGQTRGVQPRRDLPHATDEEASVEFRWSSFVSPAPGALAWVSSTP